MERFYTETIGRPVTLRWDDVPIIFIDIGSTTIELIGRDHAPDMIAPDSGLYHLALQVSDVDTAYAELVAAGVNVTEAPRNFKHVRIAFFTDPDGNVLELVQDSQRT
jgi:glyoxylase I family protein